MHRLAPLLALVVAATALALAAAAAPTAPIRRHAVPAAGMTLTLPANWVSVSPRDVASTAAQKLGRSSPQFAQVLDEMAKPGSPAKFFAFDPVTTQSFATNVNVVRVTVPAGLSFDEYLVLVRRELRQLPQSMGTTSTQTVQLPAGRAVRTHFQLRLTLSDGRKLQTDAVQYGFLRRQASVVVTYTTVKGALPRYARAFDASARSIRFA